MSQTKVEPGSFRDRNGRVFYLNGEIYRAISQTALENWQTLEQTKFFQSFKESGRLAATERVESLPETDAPEPGNWAGYLKHERINFISYPYEWSFGMLKDAALLTLDLLNAALKSNMILKDSSAFNVQFRGSQAVFIDIPSFEKLGPGEPWVGYLQFCRMFLYPLMLQAYKNIPYHTLLRGNIDGIEPAMINATMSARDRFRGGVLTHVYLQNKLQEKTVNSRENLKDNIKRAGFRKELIQANVTGLHKLVSKLKFGPEVSEWGDYAENTSYNSEDHQKKKDFVGRAAASRSWKLVWDLGCNTGDFSRIASQNAELTVSMDGDHLAIERLYQKLKSEGNDKILPLVMNLADPSPDHGWRGLERRSLPGRGKPELTLCLALIHHIVISANIPLQEFLVYLRGLDTALVIEYVDKQDEMVRTLLANKEDIYSDYERDYFEARLKELFDIKEQMELKNGHRVMYFATPR